MKAVIKSYHSPDVDFENFVPGTDSWSFLLQLIIGPDNGPGEESFDVTVCSPQWIAERAEKDGVVNGHHILVVSDFSKLKPFIEKYVSNYAVGDTWEEVTEKLSHLGLWEFEDYKPAT